MVWLDLINKPFIGHHDWNGVFYSNIARNYLRFGWFGTKLGQVTNFGFDIPQNFYTHYPPLLTWIMAGWFQLVGFGDWQARLLPLLFHLGSLGLLVRLAGPVTLVVVLTPMWRYFSLMPSQEALIIFFSLLSVVAWLNNQKKLFFFSVVANGLSGWAGYFLYLWLWLLKKRRDWLVGAGGILAGIFLLHLLHTYFLTGAIGGGGLFDALKLRLNLAGTEGFSWWNYLVLEKQRLTAFYSLTLLAAAISTLWRHDRLVLVLLGWGLSYPLVFSNVVFVHDYFNIFFIPWLGVAAAGLFNRVKWPVILVFFLLVFWERDKFYRALVATDSFRPGYELGQTINRQVPRGETAVVVGPKDFIEPENLFVSYYADREIIYLNPDEPLPEAVKYVFNLDK